MEKGTYYPDAACRPKPREPPVTTTTFPEREKREGKSFRVVWAFASAAMVGKESMGQVSLRGGEKERASWGNWVFEKRCQRSRGSIEGRAEEEAEMLRVRRAFHSLGG